MRRWPPPSRCFESIRFSGERAGAIVFGLAGRPLRPSGFDQRRGAPSRASRRSGPPVDRRRRTDARPRALRPLLALAAGQSLCQRPRRRPLRGGDRAADRLRRRRRPGQGGRRSRRRRRRAQVAQRPPVERRQARGPAGRGRRRARRWARLRRRRRRQLLLLAAGARLPDHRSSRRAATRRLAGGAVPPARGSLSPSDRPMVARRRLRRNPRALARARPPGSAARFASPARKGLAKACSRASTPTAVC